MPLHMLSWQTKAHEAVFCQSPSPLQLCMLVPEHCFAPGGHVPVQPFSLHTVVHSTAVSHDPVAVHFETIDPSHLNVPGAQMPVQAPLVQR